MRGQISSWSGGPGGRQALPLVAGAAAAAAISLRDVFTAFSFSLAARPQKRGTIHSGYSDTSDSDTVTSLLLIAATFFKTPN